MLEIEVDIVESVRRIGHGGRQYYTPSCLLSFKLPVSVLVYTTLPWHLVLYCKFVLNFNHWPCVFPLGYCPGLISWLTKAR